MRNRTLAFEKALKDAGLIAKWETEAKKMKAIEIAENMLRNGFSVEQTAELSGLDVAKVKSLCYASLEKI